VALPEEKQGASASTDRLSPRLIRTHPAAPPRHILHKGWGARERGRVCRDGGSRDDLPAAGDGAYGGDGRRKDVPPSPRPGLEKKQWWLVGV